MDYMRKLDIELEDKMKQEGVTFTYPDKDAFSKTTEPAYHVVYDMFGDRARKIVKAIKEMK